MIVDSVIPEVMELNLRKRTGKFPCLGIPMGSRYVPVSVSGKPSYAATLRVAIAKGLGNGHLEQMNRSEKAKAKKAEKQRSQRIAQRRAKHGS